MPLQPLDLPDVWVPNGYGTQYLHIREARARHNASGAPMHPAFDRRLWPAIASTAESDGKTRVGVGGGWRPTPSNTSYASKMGWSFHQTQTFTSGLRVYAAIDAVAKDGPDANFNHDGVTAEDAERIERFGLHANVGTPGSRGYEAWHWQCFEMDGYKTWVANGRLDPSMTFDVPGIGVPQPPSKPDYGLWPVNDSKPRLVVGMEGPTVEYAQTVMRNEANQTISLDGQFGPQTQKAVNNVRAVFKLPLLGVLDWDGSWEAIDLLAGWDWSETDPDQPNTPESVEPVVEVWYYVQPGDSPWKAAERIVGDGAKWQEIGLKESDFYTADYYITDLKGAGRVATVLPGDGPLQLIKRMYPTENQYKLLPRFYDLNGGEGRTVHPGEQVFLNKF